MSLAQAINMNPITKVEKPSSYILFLQETKKVVLDYSRLVELFNQADADIDIAELEASTNQLMIQRCRFNLINTLINLETRLEEKTFDYQVLLELILVSKLRIEVDSGEENADK
ncbi:MAG: hypothetical protein ACRCXZ_02770 [Patescibacteria group bacterium]